MTPHILWKYRRLLGTVAIIAILSVSVLSTIHFGMDTSSAEAMSDCPFAATQGLCAMDNTLEHTSMWQGLLAVFPASMAIPALFVAVITLFFVLFRLPILFELLYERIRIRLRYLGYALSYPTRLFAEAFSNGILNPKLF